MNLRDCVDKKETFSMALGGRMILKLIFKKLYGRAWIGFIWLNIVTSGRLL
jgi:hypothetical protein